MKLLCMVSCPPSLSGVHPLSCQTRRGCSAWRFDADLPIRIEMANLGVKYVSQSQVANTLRYSDKE